MFWPEKFDIGHSVPHVHLIRSKNRKIVAENLPAATHACKHSKLEVEGEEEEILTCLHSFDKF